MAKRDNNEQLARFAQDLEACCVEAIDNDGIMTKDLALSSESLRRVNPTSPRSDHPFVTHSLRQGDDSQALRQHSGVLAPRQGQAEREGQGLQPSRCQDLSCISSSESLSKSLYSRSSTLYMSLLYAAIVSIRFSRRTVSACNKELPFRIN